MKSRFTGNVLVFWIFAILSFIFSVITLGIGAPWAICFMMKWATRNTYIDGRKLVFKGNGGSLLGHYLLWEFLSIITLGIFSLWWFIKVTSWIVERTHFADTEEA